MALDVLHFTPCGLLLDASGVVLLGFSFFLKTTESMIEESGTTWDSEAYVTVATGRADGIFGTLLLFLGFVYQALGYAGIRAEAVVISSYAVLVGFLLIYLVFLRKWLVNRWVSAIEAKLKTPEP